jgi:hypothetical protein
MLKFKRTWWLPVLALAAVAVVSAGCGGDDDDDDDGNGGGGGSEVDVRDGTWNISVSSTYSGGEGCSGTEGPFIIPIVLCDLDDPGDISGDDEAECTQEVDGNTVEFDCVSDEDIGDGCVIRTHSSGMATFNETSFSMTVVISESTTSSSPACQSQVDPCTTTLTMTGTWASSSGAGSCNSKGTVPLSRVWGNAARLVAP